MEPEETVIASERQMNAFTRQRTRDATVEICWKLCFLLGPKRLKNEVLRIIRNFAK
jgi:hypothetical protein